MPASRPPCAWHLRGVCSPRRFSRSGRRYSSYPVPRTADRRAQSQRAGAANAPTASRTSTASGAALRPDSGARLRRSRTSGSSAGHVSRHRIDVQGRPAADAVRFRTAEETRWPATARTIRKRTACRWASCSFTRRACRRKFVQTPGLIVILYEASSGIRQIFTDGRPLPAERRSAAVVLRLLHGQVGWRHAGRRDQQPARQRVARHHRHASDGSGEAHRTFPPRELRPHGDRHHGRRSEGVHEAVDRQAPAGHHGGRRADRVHLRGEQQVSAAVTFAVASPSRACLPELARRRGRAKAGHAATPPARQPDQLARSPRRWRARRARRHRATAARAPPPGGPPSSPRTPARLCPELSASAHHPCDFGGTCTSRRGVLSGR